MSRAERRALVERKAPALPVSRQCRLLSVSRASVYRRPVPVSEQDCTIMTDDNPQPFSFPAIQRKKITAFDGRRISSDGGLMLLARADRLARMIPDVRD